MPVKSDFTAEQRLLVQDDGALPEFEGVRSELQGWHPSLPHYARLSGPFWRAFSPKLTQPIPPVKLQDFFEETLPEALRYLNGLRVPAAHDPETLPKLAEIRTLFKWFLGIGQAGVIPTLAQATSKLATDARQRKQAQDLEGGS